MLSISNLHRAIDFFLGWSATGGVESSCLANRELVTVPVISHNINIMSDRIC